MRLFKTVNEDLVEILWPKADKIMWIVGLVVTWCGFQQRHPVRDGDGQWRWWHLHQAVSSVNNWRIPLSLFLIQFVTTKPEFGPMHYFFSFSLYNWDSGLFFPLVTEIEDAPVPPFLLSMFCNWPLDQMTLPIYSSSKKKKLRGL